MSTLITSFKLTAKKQQLNELFYGKYRLFAAKAATKLKNLYIC